METKKWYQSSTIWGILLTVLITVAGWFGVIPEALPESIERGLQLAALLYATYGRTKAKKAITL